ncbi:type II toxin-antitoxin system VapC family toxin [Dyadobacter fanqingshengii]|uniref:Type II toxin-antitoxin system VapC family toxin n=1 Tax=Dyadobacter fanqingshengii TaxID=2906443 RepID=A0A9X1P848_9BACT|nr:type II toxin-antitoxin system VapC family toxin [Dyadobacter fanqingshengii]MCF0038472.1 type II toxin-antitoxin system VapC family toxin [Dyadobacter fanqingshengii]USJ34693.1 type II toxin-antitoxin system VapC family toxin [Dyadobacter fanqingshengii]
MNIILDTHTLIWFFEGDANLSAKALQAIENTENKKYVSIASLWEMAIKISLGKLYLQKPLDIFLSDLIKSDIEVLQISIAHVLQVSQLEFFHKDPFDRIIVAQAITEQFWIVTKDPNFPLYHPFNVLW